MDSYLRWLSVDRGDRRGLVAALFRLGIAFARLGAAGVLDLLLLEGLHGGEADGQRRRRADGGAAVHEVALLDKGDEIRGAGVLGLVADEGEPAAFDRDQGDAE